MHWLISCHLPNKPRMCWLCFVHLTGKRLNQNEEISSSQLLLSNGVQIKTKGTQLINNSILFFSVGAAAETALELQTNPSTPSCHDAQGDCLP